MYIMDEYYEGKKAYLEGWERDECPYDDGTPESKDWLNGYDDSEGENQIYS